VRASASSRQGLITVIRATVTSPTESAQKLCHSFAAPRARPEIFRTSRHLSLGEVVRCALGSRKSLTASVMALTARRRGGITVTSGCHAHAHLQTLTAPDAEPRDRGAHDGQGKNAFRRAARRGIDDDQTLEAVRHGTIAVIVRDHLED
jgi:hypothetical protein